MGMKKDTQTLEGDKDRKAELGAGASEIRGELFLC